jgi:hypothetical protein
MEFYSTTALVFSSTPLAQTRSITPPVLLRYKEECEGEMTSQTAIRLILCRFLANVF